MKNTAKVSNNVSNIGRNLVYTGRVTFNVLKAIDALSLIEEHRQEIRHIYFSYRGMLEKKGALHLLARFGRAQNVTVSKTKEVDAVAVQDGVEEIEERYSALQAQINNLRKRNRELTKEYLFDVKDPDQRKKVRDEMKAGLNVKIERMREALEEDLSGLRARLAEDRQGVRVRSLSGTEDLTSMLFLSWAEARAKAPEGIEGYGMRILLGRRALNRQILVDYREYLVRSRYLTLFQSEEEKEKALNRIEAVERQSAVIELSPTETIVATGISLRHAGVNPVTVERVLDRDFQRLAADQQQASLGRYRAQFAAQWRKLQELAPLRDERGRLYGDARREERKIEGRLRYYRKKIEELTQ